MSLKKIVQSEGEEINHKFIIIKKIQKDPFMKK